jgi:hypothetical protein
MFVFDKERFRGAMEITPELSVGDRVFLNSAGVSTVRGYAVRTPGGKPGPWNPGVPPDFYVIDSGDKVALVPLSQASTSLRPLMSESHARELLEVLRGPEVPVVPEPILERGKRIAHEGAARAQALFLRELYALPVPLSDALAEGLSFYERLVLGELEAVLGESPGSLASEMATRYLAANWVRRPLSRKS